MPAGGAAVVAEMADVGGGVLVRGCRSARSTASRPRAAAPGARGADRRGRRRSRRSGRGRGSPTCGSSPLTTSVVESGRSRTVRRQPLRDVLELAVAVELVAEEVSERGARAARSVEPPPAARPRPPRAGRAPHRGRRAGRRRLPRGGWRPSGSRRAGRRGRGSPPPSRSSSSSRSSPRRRPLRVGSRAASASIAPGSSFQSSLPGIVVPPPVPASRDSRAAARAASDSIARRALMARRA